MPVLTQLPATNTAYEDMTSEGVPPKLAAMIMNQYEVKEIVHVNKIRFKDRYSDGSAYNFTATKMISSPSYLYAFSSNGRFKVVHSSYWGCRDNKYRVSLLPTAAEKERFIERGYPDTTYYRINESRFAAVFSGLKAHSIIYEIKISTDHHNPYRETHKPDPRVAELDTHPLNLGEVVSEIEKIYGSYIRKSIEGMVEDMYTKLRDIPWDRDNNGRAVSWGTHGRSSGKCHAIEHIERLEKVLSQDTIFDFSDRVRRALHRAVYEKSRELGHLSNAQEITLALQVLPNIRPRMVQWFLEEMRERKQSVDDILMSAFNAKLAGK